MNLGTARVIRADARHLPLADNTIDLVVTSPPYFALRSYQDGGEHYGGQVGSEATPAEFVDALIEVTAECVRVLKPTGSLWVNLGDKYAGSRMDGSSGNGSSGTLNTRRVDGQKMQVVEQGAAGQGAKADAGNIRAKSLMGIPWRYALRCIDDLGLILRAEVIWSKPNGLPESVTDRVRRSHETWFHFTREPRYFSAVDEIREAHVRLWNASNGGSLKHSLDNEVRNDRRGDYPLPNPLGKLPGSVWTIPTEPLRVPDHLGIDHFAAFPTEWPRRIISGWSPAGICVKCGDGRRPVREVITGETEMRRVLTDTQSREWCERFQSWCRSNGVSRAALAKASRTGDMGARWWGVGGMPAVPTPEHWPLLRQAWPSIPEWFDGYVYALTEVPKRLRKPRSIGGGKDQYSFDARHNPTEQTVTGYACACPEPTAPTRPAVVLDPFGGTGTTAMVAKALGRHGISVDMSADYCRLAEWRTNDRDQLAKVLGIAKVEAVSDDEQSLLDLLDGDVA